MTETLTGWLFDLYPTATDLALWLITDDEPRRNAGGGGRRLR